MSIIENVAGLSDAGMKCAHGIAEYYLRNQIRFRDWEPGAGSFFFEYDAFGIPQLSATEWAIAFAAMGMFSAAKVFDDQRYLYAAQKMGVYLKSLQIFAEHCANIPHKVPGVMCVMVSPAHGGSSISIASPGKKSILNGQYCGLSGICGKVRMKMDCLYGE